MIWSKSLSTPLQWELRWNPEHVKSCPHSSKQQTKPHDIQRREKLNSKTSLVTKQPANPVLACKPETTCAISASSFQGSLYHVNCYARNAKLWFFDEGFKKHAVAMLHWSEDTPLYAAKCTLLGSSEAAMRLLSVSEAERNFASNDILLTRLLARSTSGIPVWSFKMDARAGDLVEPVGNIYQNHSESIKAQLFCSGIDLQLGLLSQQREVMVSSPCCKLETNLHLANLHPQRAVQWCDAESAQPRSEKSSEANCSQSLAEPPERVIRFTSFWHRIQSKIRQKEVPCWDWVYYKIEKWHPENIHKKYHIPIPDVGDKLHTSPLVISAMSTTRSFKFHAVHNLKA